MIAIPLSNISDPDSVFLKGDIRPLPAVILEAKDQIGPELLECPNKVRVGIRELIRVHHRRGPDGGCSQSDLRGTGGDGLFYCFAAN
jgi:hypothetical protein